MKLKHKKQSAMPSMGSDMIAGKSQMAEAWERLRHQPIAMVCLGVIVVMALLAIFADLLFDYDAQVVAQDVYNKFAPFSAAHWLGTDHLGRDMMARIVYGIRTAFLMGIVANLITVVIAIALSCICAYFGGKVDMFIMRLVDILCSMPPLVLSIAICSGLGNGMWQLIVALAAGGIGPLTQMFRSETLNIANKEYMEAGRAIGITNAKLIVKYMIPNMISIVLVQFTSRVSMNIMSGATLSFIGLGVKAPTPEWGMILSEGRNYFMAYPRLVIIPGIALMLTSFVISCFGDCLRDALDPKLKGRI